MYLSKAQVFQALALILHAYAQHEALHFNFLFVSNINMIQKYALIVINDFSGYV